MEIVLNAFFSRHSSEAMVGSFLGGGYINNHRTSFSSDIERGQLMSISIDRFIENSPICKESIMLLSPKARKYSGRILRLYYDHLLARNWVHYSDIPYDEFCEDILEVLKTHNHFFPYKPKKVVNRVIRKNLVSSIRTINGLNEYIKDLTRYNSYNSIIQESIGTLVGNYGSFNRDFDLIFPALEKEFLVKELKVS